MCEIKFSELDYSARFRKIKRNVLVVGGAGVGKSTLIYYCDTTYAYGKDDKLIPSNIHTGDSLKGVTSIKQDYFGHLAKWVDTVGLNETKDGTIDAAQSIETLINLIKDNKEGFTVVLIVIKKGRKTEEVQRTIDFLSGFIDASVPKYIIITGFESSWKARHKWMTEPLNSQVLNGWRKRVREVIPTSFASSDDEDLESVYEKSRAESINATQEIVKAHVDCKPLYTSEEGFTWLLKKTWNVFAGWKVVDPWVNEDLVEMLRGLKLNEKDAKQKAMQLG